MIRISGSQKTKLDFLNRKPNFTDKPNLAGDRKPFIFEILYFSQEYELEMKIHFLGDSSRKDKEKGKTCPRKMQE